LEKFFDRNLTSCHWKTRCEVLSLWLQPANYLPDDLLTFVDLMNVCACLKVDNDEQILVLNIYSSQKWMSLFVIIEILETIKIFPHEWSFHKIWFKRRLYKKTFFSKKSTVCCSIAILHIIYFFCNVRGKKWEINIEHIKLALMSTTL